MALMSMRRELRSLSFSGPKGWVVAAVIGVQVAVPAIALLDEPPTRFGFQMYSAQGGVKVESVDAEGQSIEVNLDSVIAGSLRPEFDWTQGLPERICALTPGAVQATVEQPERTRVLRCD